MTFIYDNVSGRIAAVVLQGTPTPPGGFTLSGSPILIADPLTKFWSILGGLLMNLNALKISGAPFVGIGTVGQIVVQKIDGTTGAPLTGSGDNDPVAYDLENPSSFLNKPSDNLANGAAAVKVAAPQAASQSRFLVFSKALQILDTTLIFS